MVNADASDRLQVRAGDCADTVDAVLERCKTPLSYRRAAGELRCGQRVSEEQADLRDEGGDANDLKAVASARPCWSVTSVGEPYV